MGAPLLSCTFTTALVTVSATSTERNAPTRLSTADSATATLGRSAPVAIEVAIALPVSWKPLVKSKARAVPITSTRMSVASVTDRACYRGPGQRHPRAALFAESSPAPGRPSVAHRVDAPADDPRVGRAHDLGVLAVVVEPAEEGTHRVDPRPLLVVALDRRPRRPVGVRTPEHRLLGRGVVVPLVQRLQVDRGQLPLSHR